MSLSIKSGQQDQGSSSFKLKATGRASGQKGSKAQGAQQKDDMAKIRKKEYQELKMKAQQGGLGQG